MSEKSSKGSARGRRHASNVICRFSTGQTAALRSKPRQSVNSEDVVNPEALLPAIRSLIRIGAAARAAAEQKVRDADFKMPKAAPVRTRLQQLGVSDLR
ncbi:MAG: hypothetical protein ACE5NW_14400 [Acidiferrobacterales bacterium]